MPANRLQPSMRACAQAGIISARNLGGIVSAARRQLGWGLQWSERMPEGAIDLTASLRLLRNADFGGGIRQRRSLGFGRACGWRRRNGSFLQRCTSRSETDSGAEQVEQLRCWLRCRNAAAGRGHCALHRLLRVAVPLAVDGTVVTLRVGQASLDGFDQRDVCSICRHARRLAGRLFRTSCGGAMVAATGVEFAS